MISRDRAAFPIWTPRSTLRVQYATVFRTMSQINGKTARRSLIKERREATPPFPRVTNFRA
jgi:hypothetical protein